MEPSRARSLAACLVVGLAVTACNTGPGPQPHLTLSRTALDLGETTEGHQKSDQFVVRNVGSATLKVQLSTSASWLTVDTTAASLDVGEQNTVTVTAECPPQDSTVEYDETVTITHNEAGVGPKTVAVSITCHDTLPSGFDIEVRYFGATLPTPSQQAVFEAAAARWSELIVGDLPDMVNVSVDGSACGHPDLVNEDVDDVVIFAQVAPDDGPGKRLGFAGPCWYRFPTTPHLPFTGVMSFDSADIAALEADGSLQAVILHEMGHVLGIGTLWQDPGMYLDAPCNSAAPPATSRFVGAEANARHVEAGGVPDQLLVETDGGPGTACGHWDEDTYVNEVMTGFLDNGENPVSAITAGSLADLGYDVNYLVVDEYDVPPAGSLRAASTARPIGLVERPTPIPYR